MNTTKQLLSRPSKPVDRPPPPAVNARPYLSLLLDLSRWGAKHEPKLFEAIAAKLDAPDVEQFTLRCLGAIFRRRAQADLPWLFQSLRESPGEVLELSEWITPGDKRVCGLWPLEGGGRGAWRQWMRQVEMAEPEGFFPVGPDFFARPRTATAAQAPAEAVGLFGGGR